MRVFIIVFLTMICFTFPRHAVGQEELKTKAKKPAISTEIQADSLSFLPKGTIISRQTQDKIYCFLPRNTMIQGLLCRGDKHRGWETVFYRNGKLAMAWLARTEEIQGVPCMAASFWTEVFRGKAAVHFYDNGKLERCKLAKDVTIEGHAFKKGEHVSFDREGKLILLK